MAARSRLNPAAGAMLSAVWASSTGQLALVIHHLAVDGVSWRILLEDLNIAWAQHHGGQPPALPVARHVVRPVVALLAEQAASPAVVDQAEAWRQVTELPAALPAVQPGTIPTPVPGSCRRRWMSRRPACCWVRCPRRSMLGCKTSC